MTFSAGYELTLNILLGIFFCELTLNILLGSGESEHLAGLAPAVLIPCLEQCEHCEHCNQKYPDFLGSQVSFLCNLLLHSPTGLRYGQGLEGRVVFGIYRNSTLELEPWA